MKSVIYGVFLESMQSSAARVAGSIPVGATNSGPFLRAFSLFWAHVYQDVYLTRVRSGAKPALRRVQ